MAACDAAKIQAVTRGTVTDGSSLFCNATPDQAQMHVPSADNVVRTGVARYESHSSTNGLSGISGIGVPPTIKAKATGSVAFLGDDVLSAKNVAPTLLFDHRFFSPSDAWRPFLGAGINDTRFTNVKSKLASKVELGDSYGLALHGRVNYAITKEWGLFASVARLDVKSKLVATGSTVLTTTIDFKPWFNSFGGYWQF